MGNISYPKKVIEVCIIIIWYKTYDHQYAPKIEDIDVIHRLKYGGDQDTPEGSLQGTMIQVQVLLSLKSEFTHKQEEYGGTDKVAEGMKGIQYKTLETGT